MATLLFFLSFFGYWSIAAIVARSVFLYWKATGQLTDRPQAHEGESAFYIGAFWPFILIYFMVRAVIFHGLFPIASFIHRHQWFLAQGHKDRIEAHRQFLRDTNIARLEPQHGLASIDVAPPTPAPIIPKHLESPDPKINSLLHQATEALPPDFDIDSVEVTDKKSLRLLFHAHGDGLYHNDCLDCYTYGNSGSEKFGK